MPFRIALLTVATLLAILATTSVMAAPGDTPAEAITISGTTSGTAQPGQTVWFKFYYGTPGSNTQINISYTPTSAGVRADLYRGSPPFLTLAATGTPSTAGTIQLNLNEAAANWFHVALVNTDSSLVINFTLSVSPLSPTPTPSVTTTPTATATGTSTPTATPTAAPTSTPVPTSTLVPRDARYFPQTGFRIDNDAIWTYFMGRGGIDAFGYPVSRTFRFLGFVTQFFQRQLVQVGPDGNARFMNLLDPGLMGFNTINFSTFPPFDSDLAASAPGPGSPGYDTAIIAFIQQNVPDTFNGMPVNFLKTFQSTVTCDIAFPGQPCQENLLPLMDLEVWGSVTSRPMADPSNSNFIYLRFQRGIMHYDATNNITRGILLADWFKSLITGSNLPPDLEQQARAANSPYLRQYCPDKPNWICRPEQLAATDLTFAFERQ